MVHSPSLYIAVLGCILTTAVAGDAGSPLPSSCREIARSISGASAVYGPPSINYTNDISHWASSSTQSAACSFEPGTAEDVGIALRILGKSQIPFAVKGGGHTTNPGFSSTSGVQIAMTRFSEITYNSLAQTATLGAGLIWDDVYAALEPHGVNVLGGRASGIGVAGLTLGGGYSWLTDQYGLTIDTVQAYELVFPNGTVTSVTNASNPDLFFALKGGFNNFGIVTRFTLKTFPQSQVWGGLITYSADVLDQVNLAVANFSANNSDPKAGILPSFSYFSGQTLVSHLIFYDAPLPPNGIFNEFLAIPSLSQNISTRSFLSLVQSAPSNSTYGTRGFSNTVSLTNYPLSLLKSIVNESIYWGQMLDSESEFVISYSVEPFLPTLFSHGTPSAYPPSRGMGYFPLSIYYAWTSSDSDQAFLDAIQTSASTLKAQAIKSGQAISDAALYPNYAIFDTPLADMYGANVARLQEIKARVDPENVMGLAGGFKF